MKDLMTQQILAELRLSGMARELIRQSDDMQCQKLGFEQRLLMLLTAERDLRQNKRIANLVKRANLRYSQANLEDVDYATQRNLDPGLVQSLSSCAWISKGKNLLILGATGTGKSWLACAFAKQACRNGLSTIYTTATNLFEEIASSLLDQSYQKLKKQLCSARVLVIDDFGLGGIPNNMAPILLEILDRQSMNGSLIIASQHPETDWYHFFDDPAIADAILDRVVYESNQIHLKGESMRKVRAKRNT